MTFSTQHPVCLHTIEYDDWNEVCEALGTCNSKWKDIARGVGLAPDQIDEIEENERRASDRLSKVIQTWIGQNYNTQKFGLPSWRTLCKALLRCDTRLCKQLAREHPGIENLSGRLSAWGVLIKLLNI